MIFYSDGFAEYLGDKEFLRIVRQGDKEALDDYTVLKAASNISTFGTDRTLVFFCFAKRKPAHPVFAIVLRRHAMRFLCADITRIPTLIAR